MKTLTKKIVLKYVREHSISRVEAVQALANLTDDHGDPIYDSAQLPAWGRCPVSDTVDVWSWDASTSEALIHNMESIVDYSYFSERGER